MRTYDFANERAFQEAHGLRHRPARFTRLETARMALRHFIKPHRIIEVGETSSFISGYYIVCPSDASRLERAGYKVTPFFN